MDVEMLRQAVDRAALTSRVCKLVGNSTVVVTDWDAQPLRYDAGAYATHSLFRVSGSARDHEQVFPWTFILKVLRPPPGTRYWGGQPDPTRPPYDNFWMCEPLAYQSGLLAELPGIRAPRCFGVDVTPEGLVWLWLEEVQEDSARVWTLERFGLAARHFGRFNGAYVGGRPLPTDWWLSRGRNGPQTNLSPAIWLDPAAFIESDETWNHPLVRRAYPVPIEDRLRGYWADYDIFYRTLQPLPRTLCHFDAFRPNLLARHDPSGHDQTIAIDWEFVGIGRIGEDLGAMVASTLAWFEFSAEKARDLGETVFDGYLAGLRDAGWTGDAALARLGYAISVACFVIPVSAVHLMVDPARWESWLSIWGRPLDELVHQWSLVTYFLLDMVDEARQLMGRR